MKEPFSIVLVVKATQLKNHQEQMCTQDREVLTQASLPHSWLVLLSPPFESLIRFLFHCHCQFEQFCLENEIPNDLKVTPSLVKKTIPGTIWQADETVFTEERDYADKTITLICWRNWMGNDKCCLFVSQWCFLIVFFSLMPTNTSYAFNSSSILAVSSIPCIYSEAQWVRKAKNMQCLPS